MTERKDRIFNLLKETKRAGIEDLLDYMDKGGFFDAPCSTRYHLAEPGGLAQHSLNVLTTALAMASTLHSKTGASPITFDFINSITICALLHDLGKMGQFGKPQYTTEEVPFADPGEAFYSTNKDLLYVPHEVRSVAIASKFIDLTEEEQHAILYHNGLYGELQSIKGKETPLYMILHFADMWASRVIEE